MTAMHRGRMPEGWETDLSDHEGAKDAACQLDMACWLGDHPDFGAPREGSQ